MLLKFMYRAFIILFFALGFISKLSAQTLLEVEITDVTHTDYMPVIAADQIPVESFYVLDAKVLNVISGQYNSDTITFAQLMLTQYKTPVRAYIYVDLMADIEMVSALGTPYFSLETAIPQSVVCFEGVGRFITDEILNEDITLKDGTPCFHEDNLQREAEAYQ